MSDPSLIASPEPPVDAVRGRGVSSDLSSVHEGLRPTEVY